MKNRTVWSEVWRAAKAGDASDKVVELMAADGRDDATRDKAGLLALIERKRRATWHSDDSAYYTMSAKEASSPSKRGVRRFFLSLSFVFVCFSLSSCCLR